MKFPVVMYLKKQSFPYVYTLNEKKRMHRSSLDIVNSKKVNGIKIIDSDGLVYSVKKVLVVKYLGLWGFTLRYKGRSVYIDYEFEDNVDFIALDDFKNDVIKRIHKTANFWKESYDDINELISLINQSESYEKVMMLIH